MTLDAVVEKVAYIESAKQLLLRFCSRTAVNSVISELTSSKSKIRVPVYDWRGIRRYPEKVII